MAGNKELLEIGTKGNRVVNKKLKEAIEQGTASDCYYFTDAGDDKYYMQPKLPEYGCSAPGKPIFKIRENNNRIVKGFAQKFLDKDQKVDYEAGLRFTEEFRMRFGLGVKDAVNPENPFADCDTAFHDAVEWLSREFDVPMEERRDFSNFCYAAFNKYENAAFGNQNFGDIWSEFALNGIAARMQFEKGKVFGELENAPDEIMKAIRGINDAEEELQDMARMDPVNTKRMYTVTECSGSKTSNKRFLEMARQARIENGETVPTPKIKEFNVDIKEFDEKIYSAENKAKIALEKHIDEAPKNFENLEEYNRKLEELSKAAADAINEADKLRAKGERKWDYHYAPVIGEFVYGDEKYYLTTEAFAAETDTFMEHPGMTDGLEIGIFKSSEDFVNFYRTDDAYVQGNETTQKLIDEKKKGKEDAKIVVDRITKSVNQFTGFALPDNPKLQNVAEIADKQLRDEICLKEWENRYRKHLEHPDKSYTPTMGINQEGVTDDKDIERRQEIRDGQTKIERVQMEYQKQFCDFLGVVQELQAECETLARAEFYNDKAYDILMDEENPIRAELLELRKNNGSSRKIEKLETKLQKIREDNKIEHDVLQKANEDIITPKLTEAAYARSEAMHLLDAALYGGDNVDGHEKDVARVEGRRALEERLKAKGYTLLDMQNMAKAIHGNFLPPSEIRMDVQVGLTGFANEFMRASTLDEVNALSPQAKEFATHNFDLAFNPVFTKEKQAELAERGQTMFDHIFIDGISVSELFKDKYKDCSFAEKQDFLKMETMKQILSGKNQRIEAALPDANGFVRNYPLNVTTNIPRFLNAVARVTKASKNPEMNFDDKINVQMAHLSDAKNWRLSGVLTGIVNTEAFETMKIYRNFGDGMSSEEKLKQGAAVIQSVTNLNVLNEDGSINNNRLDTLMSNVCVNGVPMRNLIQGKINDNKNQVVDLMAGYIVNHMDENNLNADTVSVISNGKHVPLTFTPPKAPEITTKANFFSSRDTKTAHANEVHAHEAGVKRQEIWEQKNARATKACQNYKDVKHKTTKERMNYAEFAEFDSSKTRKKTLNKNINKELNAPKKKQERTIG